MQKTPRPARLPSIDLQLIYCGPLDLYRATGVPRASLSRLRQWGAATSLDPVAGDYRSGKTGSRVHGFEQFKALEQDVD